MPILARDDAVVGILPRAVLLWPHERGEGTYWRGVPRDDMRRVRALPVAEIKRLSSLDPAKATVALAATWGVIAVAIVAAVVWWHPLVVAAAHRRAHQSRARAAPVAAVPAPRRGTLSQLFADKA
jgi:hypothetical protein